MTREYDSIKSELSSATNPYTQVTVAEGCDPHMHSMLTRMNLLTEAQHKYIESYELLTPEERRSIERLVPFARRLIRDMIFEQEYMAREFKRDKKEWERTRKKNPKQEEDMTKKRIPKR